MEMSQSVSQALGLIDNELERIQVEKSSLLLKLVTCYLISV